MSDRIFRVSASALYLRDGPSRGAQALTRLPHRQAVARLDETDWDGWWWVFADVPGDGVFEGYVFSEHLTPLDSAEPPPAPEAPPVLPSDPEPAPAPAPPDLAPSVRLRRNGTILPLDEAGLFDVFGQFQYENGAKRGSVRILGEWAEQNIIDVEIPALAHLPGGGRLKLHAKAAPSYQKVFSRILDAGLQSHILTCSGTFVPRRKGWDPDRSLSSHSWGVAIDLNAEWNGYGVRPAASGAHGSLLDILPFFTAEGFAWGGHFSGAYVDGMHFELARLDL